jgi:hypothetical protein
MLQSTKIEIRNPPRIFPEDVLCPRIRRIRKFEGLVQGPLETKPKSGDLLDSTFTITSTLLPDNLRQQDCRACSISKYTYPQSDVARTAAKFFGTGA